MAWVTTRLCVDGLDTSCLSVCPVNCIYAYIGPDRARFPNQLYINPDECIECGGCEPECSWQAIYTETAVPEPFRSDIELNRRVAEMPDQFGGYKRRPTPEEVAANKRKWGLDPSARRTPLPTVEPRETVAARRAGKSRGEALW